MSNTGQTGDASYVTRTNLLKGKTYAQFARAYPTTQEFVQVNKAQSEYQYKVVGDTEECCCPFSIKVIGPVLYGEPPFNQYFDVSWTQTPGATTYTLTANYNGLFSVVRTSAFTGRIFVQSVGGQGNVTIKVTALKECGDQKQTAVAVPIYD